MLLKAIFFNISAHKNTIACYFISVVDGDSGVWELMPREHFRPISVPFSLEGVTEDNPCSLPDVYKDELAKRKE